MLTQEQLEKAVLSATKDAALRLKDSPISLNYLKATQIGYYSGYCDAKGWEINNAVIKAIEQENK